MMPRLVAIHTRHFTLLHSQCTFCFGLEKLSSRFRKSRKSCGIAGRFFASGAEVQRLAQMIGSASDLFYRTFAHLPLLQCGLFVSVADSMNDRD
jgi:hypothetical protein